MMDSQLREHNFTCSDLFSFSLLNDFYPNSFLALEDDPGDEDVVDGGEILKTQCSVLSTDQTSRLTLRWRTGLR